MPGTVGDSSPFVLDRHQQTSFLRALIAFFNVLTQVIVLKLFEIQIK